MIPMQPETISYPVRAIDSNQTALQSGVKFSEYSENFSHHYKRSSELRFTIATYAETGF
ncbi:hypothetical protein QUA56_06625 [Microcoleus sp. N3A4]|uniref:hypothetical protein n=1 Tax=Microcoleus sp. N3A4 TaxID=3055379 RepID=UPI002FD5C98F